ncbi:MAG TPA: phosphogluconate dehydrogenase C-terminal domain-containing protein [Cyclobacteriaceae bacterium]|nr:phosphogluconate dehydrogenase C-terminal domain-containing protein [Cyclobacteriaceae bacterium]
MKKVVLAGAGGKMGVRLTNNLKRSEYQMQFLEVSPEGIERVRANGVDVSRPADAVPGADCLILAVPDVLIRKVAHELVPLLRPGAMCMTLDPAAPIAGALPERKDIAYFATHPCHPSVFNHEADPEKHFDFFGGIAARQSIVCALIHGSENDYSSGEHLARIMYAPVEKAHRITLWQMGILEPALSETFGAALVSVMKEAIETAIAKGVPRDAAYDFFLGHVNIELALVFGKLPGGKFSDAALKAINLGKSLILKDDWKKIFEPESIKEQIRAIT